MQVRELIGVELHRQARGLCRFEDPRYLFGIKGDALAEGVHRIGEARSGDLRHHVDHRVDVILRTRVELRR